MLWGTFIQCMKKKLNKLIVYHFVEPIMEISLNLNLRSKTNGSPLFHISSINSFVKFEKIESADPYNLLAIRIDNQL